MGPVGARVDARRGPTETGHYDCVPKRPRPYRQRADLLSLVSPLLEPSPAVSSHLPGRA